MMGFYAKHCRPCSDAIKSTLIDRFWAKVDRTPGHGPWGDCWVWTAATVKGYGSIMNDGTISGARMQRANRVSWILHNGETDLHVLHKYDNPSCVNPAHLFTGTNTENMADKVAKKRHPRGTAQPAAKLSEEKVLAAFRLRDMGFTGRDLAWLYGVTPQTMSKALKGQTWHIAHE